MPQILWNMRGSNSKMLQRQLKWQLAVSKMPQIVGKIGSTTNKKEQIGKKVSLKTILDTLLTSPAHLWCEMGPASKPLVQASGFCCCCCCCQCCLYCCSYRSSCFCCSCCCDVTCCWWSCSQPLCLDLLPLAAGRGRRNSQANTLISCKYYMPKQSQTNRRPVSLGNNGYPLEIKLGSDKPTVLVA